MTVEARRLRWNCRRGLLELDIVLHRFIDRYPQEPRLGELLELADNDLLDIVMGRSDAYAPHLEDLVMRLRAA